MFIFDNNRLTFYQHKDVSKTNQDLNNFFQYISVWFVDNKLSIHLGKDKQKAYSSAQNINKLKLEVLILDMVQFALRNITQ